MTWALERVPDAGTPELVKHRPWSTVWRIPTPAGPVWLKHCPERTRHEVRLLGAMARWAVPHVLEPLAVDEDLGTVLLPDGGPTLREAPGPSWAAVLAGYAQTQRATEAHVDELVALGVPDLRPALLPAAFERLARRWAPDVLPLLGRLADEAAELSELGPAPTIQHDDLHDGNVFARDGRVFDWGDACVAHPLTSLLIGWDGSAGPLAAYLARWPTVPRRAVDLGVRLGIVTRTDSWDRALAGWADPPEQFRDAPAQWLRRLLDERVGPGLDAFG
ncbi:phosphotransferase family protein [Kineococcus rhizosphaerae]|uniref:phosphotransferase family protein n=1 Tax=Kineococcus rhizosphaerae TaxID=559628 RepID=UPI0014741B69|nr:phosphotransferase [Kineococcus rhizosphaerae]